MLARVGFEKSTARQGAADNRHAILRCPAFSYISTRPIDPPSSSVLLIYPFVTLLPVAVDLLHPHYTLHTARELRATAVRTKSRALQVDWFLPAQTGTLWVFVAKRRRSSKLSCGGDHL